MKVIVEKNKATLREWQGKVLTSGTVGEMLRFEFSPEWDGLVKTAVFCNGVGELPDKTIRSDNTVEIPAEALARAGLNLRVGVYGESLEGNLVIPTVYASLGMISQGAAKTYRPAHPPAPDWTARVDRKLQETVEIAEEMQRKADAGEFDGKAGAPGIDGTDYILTSADKVEIEEAIRNQLSFTGQPIFVDTIEEMTDNSKVYVLTSTGTVWARMSETVTKTITDKITEGFVENSRLGSDGSVASGYAGYVTTPLIDLGKYKTPFTLHLKGIPFYPAESETYTKIGVYNSQQEKVLAGAFSRNGSPWRGCWDEERVEELPSQDGNLILRFTPPVTRNRAQVPYARFSAKGTGAEANIFITYETTITGERWMDTRLQYTPTISEAEKQEIAKDAAALIDAKMLNIIGDGVIS